jgi:hypothetical protein
VVLEGIGMTYESVVKKYQDLNSLGCFVSSQFVPVSGDVGYGAIIKDGVKVYQTGILEDTFEEAVLVAYGYMRGFDQ